MYKKTIKRPQYNAALPFIKKEYTGNVLNDKGQYINLDGPSERSLKDVIKWQSTKKELKELKKNQQSTIEVKKDGDFLNCTKDGITWLGHCSFIFTLNRLNIITDPVLGKVSNLMPRYTDIPITTDKLKSIDLILISHNHRDHLDKKSMQIICTQNPNAIIYTGLEIGKLIRQWKIKNTVIEAGWHQLYPSINQINIAYLPAKHWNRRAIRDTNEMLWGSFILQTESTTIYFGGDSGYGIHFKEIAEIFPSIDAALIGIGAYKPEWFMHTSHTSPKDALQVAKDLNAKKLIPMHYGTFDLSDEPIYYAQQDLVELAAQDSNLTQQVQCLSIGEKLYFL